jgi:cytochrome c biogenesis protein CcdA
MTAIEGNFAYSFLLGVLAAVNPCGFVLLPTYLVYYLGLESRSDDSRAVALARALKVGSAVSAGFVSLFLVVGTVTRLFTDALTRNAKYLSLVIGVALFVAGIAMLRGWKPRIVTPEVGTRRDRTVGGMFLFGLAYAVASIGCTIGFLVSVILGSVGRHGFVSGIISVSLYGLGMGLLVTSLTVAIALARTGFVGFLRRGLRWFDTVSAVLVTLTGAYLSWYWWGAISERGSDSVVRRVDGWQSSVASFLQEIGAWRLAAVFLVAVGAALWIALGRRRARGV